MSATSESDEYYLTYYFDTSYPTVYASIPITVLPVEEGVMYQPYEEDKLYDLYDTCEEAYEAFRNIARHRECRESVVCVSVA